VGSKVDGAIRFDRETGLGDSDHHPDGQHDRVGLSWIEKSRLLHLLEDLRVKVVAVDTADRLAVNNGKRCLVTRSTLLDAILHLHV